MTTENDREVAPYRVGVYGPYEMRQPNAIVVGEDADAVVYADGLVVATYIPGQPCPAHYVAPKGLPDVYSAAMYFVERGVRDFVLINGSLRYEVLDGTLATVPLTPPVDRSIAAAAEALGDTSPKGLTLATRVVHAVRLVAQDEPARRLEAAATRATQTRDAALEASRAVAAAEHAFMQARRAHDDAVRQHEDALEAVVEAREAAADAEERHAGG